jgi:hypothetical protein
MKITTRLRRLQWLKGHIREDFVVWATGKRKHTKRFEYRCVRCGLKLTKEQA